MAEKRESSFPQREVVDKLADAADRVDFKEATSEENVHQAEELKVNETLHVGRSEALLHQELMKSRQGLKAARNRNSRDEDGETDSKQDPLSDVIDWLAFADLGADDPSRSNGGGSLEDSPGTPTLAARSSSSSRPYHGDSRASHSPRNGGVPIFQRGQRKPGGGYCGLGNEELAGPILDPEEEEWVARQAQTGAAGRLVIYEFGDKPHKDFHLRGGGSNRRLIVAGVKRGGKAELAGVKAGDVLVSIDGKKDFAGLSAEVVQRRLRAPAMLVFMGFVGKLHAEVRLNYKDDAAGLSCQDQVVIGRPEAPLQLADEVVFQPTSAPLFLAVEADTLPEPQLATASSSGPPGLDMSAGDDGDVPALVDDDLDDLGIEFTGPILAAALEEINGDGAEAEEFTPEKEASTMGGPVLDVDSIAAMSPRVMGEEQQQLAAVYELRGQEARKMVSHALLRARSSASKFSDNSVNATSTANPSEQIAPQPMADQSPRTNLTDTPDLLTSKQFPRIGGKVDRNWNDAAGGHCGLSSWPQWWSSLFE
eukprot:TRINITY_DN3240_c0_g1_i1.p1 TRINITY_DN3240_c0_g1~~TRINITY_DN3240_c0_g1_i1.p1  ORF type:complete len:537 (-),score=116.54 TRINITY_DN3240_c0_g1_i1:182-1792(-)